MPRPAYPMKTVTYRGVLHESTIREIKSAFKLKGTRFSDAHVETVTIPEGVTTGVDSDVYGGYRRGLVGGCADVVILTRHPEKGVCVVLSQRNNNVCFGGTWWIHGGAGQAYQDIIEFVQTRATKECGAKVDHLVYLGTYQTMAGDHIGSTVQPCFATAVPYAELNDRLHVDEGHAQVRLFSRVELDGIPAEGRHWYPLRVASLAMAALHDVV